MREPLTAVQANEACWHDKPAAGRCCWRACPNYAGNFRSSTTDATNRALAALNKQER